MTAPSHPANPIFKMMAAASPLRKLVALVVLLAAGLLFWKLVKDNTTVSFTFLLDGKPLAGGTAPTVRIDGKAFTSGLTISPGPHKLAVEFPNAEPFARRVWVFFGAKNLGGLPLETSKGSLLVSVNPSPATVIVRRGVEVLGRGNAPLTVENLPIGDYELEIQRNEYKEVRPVTIQGKPRTAAKIELNLGSVELSATPTNADFTLSGNGRPPLKGKLPIRLDDVPGGSYKLVVRRGEYEEPHQIEVLRQQRSQTNILLKLGSVDLSATPANADFKLSGNNGWQKEDKLPIRLDDVPVGSYNLTVRRGKYEETHQVEVLRQQRFQTNILLKLGGVDLSASHTNADFKLSRDGRQWEEVKLPNRLEDVPAGKYSLIASRNGWELDAVVVSVVRGAIATNITVFHYGSISVASDPAGFEISSNGVKIGTAPFVHRELKPGQYTLTATDGEGEQKAEITVRQGEQTKHPFIFKYGAAQIASKPSGATVLRKGKTIGVTPLDLSRLPVGEAKLALSLPGYVSTNLTFHIAEKATTNLNIKLISERYLEALREARKAFESGQFAAAQKILAIAKENEPDDKEVKALENDVLFKIRYQKAEMLSSSNNQFSEALVELAEAEKLQPDSTDVVKLRRMIEKERLERFNALVQNAENSLSGGRIYEANRDLNEAERFIANNSRVTDVRAKIAPLIRQTKWQELVSKSKDSPVSLSYSRQYRMNLFKFRDATVAVINGTSEWKLTSENIPDDHTYILILAKPKGLASILMSEDYWGVMMLSRLQDGFVEIRSKYWIQSENKNVNLTPAAVLSLFVDKLDGRLAKTLGQPVKSTGSIGQPLSVEQVRQTGSLLKTLNLTDSSSQGSPVQIGVGIQNSPAWPVIQRAAEAHGGAQNILRINATKTRVRGKNFITGEGFVDSDCIFYNKSGQLRQEASFQLKRGVLTEFMTYSEGKARGFYNGNTSTVSSAATENLKREAFIMSVSSLRPLLTGEVKFKNDGNVDVNGKTYSSLTVVSDDNFSVTLLFDPETGLYSRRRSTRKDQNGNLVSIELVFSNYSTNYGIKTAGHFEGFENGKLTFQGDVLEMTALQDIPNEYFNDPSLVVPDIQR